MRVSRARSEENRQAVVEAAARLFRERGFDGVGLNELMEAAGLTQGGFYKKFTSKDDLTRRASAAALTKNRLRMTHRVSQAKGRPLEVLVRAYLATGHRDDIANGCAFAALGADAARRGDPGMRQIFDDELRAYLELVEAVLAEAPDQAARDRAITILATMVGALMLSRLVEDPALSDRFLTAAAAAILGKD